jgi:hypothetical protein
MAQLPASTSQDPLGVLPFSQTSAEAQEETEEKEPSPTKSESQSVILQSVEELKGETEDNTDKGDVHSMENEEKNVKGTEEQTITESDVPTVVDHIAAADISQNVEQEAEPVFISDPSNHEKAQLSDEEPSTPPTVTPSSTPTTVEELQSRLKLVEQRFTGMSTPDALFSLSDVVLQTYPLRLRGYKLKNRQQMRSSEN